MKLKTMDLLAIIIVGVLLYFLVVRPLFGIGLDDTDASKWNRSGMRIHTDAKTGVQYLSTAGGGLTPRLNADGSIMRRP
jgi:hypothetical protein